ncbi:site-specific DNA-methyltransferase [Sphingomonas sp. NIC1]|uniref:site-specific DNA-methyltransferase n=1 Tax=Sphingomonas sp. NIC1 TaxID=1961362 RepID=UPI00125DC241|nr:site-specific DNA-methyltransferase [Sphingomonas sp. NIC1]
MSGPWQRREVIGKATLYLGDCEAILPSLQDCADIAFTSPPYNMGLVPGGNGRGMYAPGANNKGGRFRDGYGAFKDALPQDEYDAWQRRILWMLYDTARHAVFYNHRPRVEHGLLRTPLSGEYGLPLRQIIIWDRGTGIDVNLRNFCTRQEWVLLFAKAPCSGSRQHDRRHHRRLGRRQLPHRPASRSRHPAHDRRPPARRGGAGPG